MTATDLMEILLHPESEPTDRWRFTVRCGPLAYQCEVDARLARNCPESAWWAERGNAGVAKYEARKWAEERAKEMAMRAFASRATICDHGRQYAHCGECWPTVAS